MSGVGSPPTMPPTSGAPCAPRSWGMRTSLTVPIPNGMKRSPISSAPSRRLTNLKGVAAGLPRTPEGARTALLRYEEQNQDLDRQTRRLLGLAALGRYFGRRNLELAVGGRLPNAPFRDWSWRWWNVLYHSGLAGHWDRFVHDIGKGGLRRAATTLRRRVSRKAYLLFLKRAGTNPHNVPRPSTGYRWTKAGVWRTNSNWTRIFILKQHLPGRSMGKHWQRRLGNKGVKLIESELFQLYDPDRLPQYEIKQRAIEYVRRRIADMIGYKKPMGYRASCWFFNAKILTPLNHLLVPREGGRVILMRIQGLSY